MARSLHLMIAFCQTCKTLVRLGNATGSSLWNLSLPRRSPNSIGTSLSLSTFLTRTRPRTSRSRLSGISKLLLPLWMLKIGALKVKRNQIIRQHLSRSKFRIFRSRFLRRKKSPRLSYPQKTNLKRRKSQTRLRRLNELYSWLIATSKKKSKK